MMGRVIKVFYLNLLIIFCAITSIQADCKVYITEDRSIRPNVYKYVGSKKLKVNQNYVLLREGQEIEAHCAINFENQKTNQLFIKCTNYIYTKTNKEHSYSRYSEYYNSHSEITLKCSTEKWKLLESSTKFAWCPTYATSYYVGRYIEDYEFLAGICYDLYDQSLSSVYYTLAPKYSDYVKPSYLIYNTRTAPEPPYEIKYVNELFSPNSISAMDFDNEQFQNLITYSNYEYSSIMQMPKLSSTLNEQFSSLLQFLWWPNLRLNNWKRYETALAKHVEKDDQAYDILAGVSGTLKAPIIENCQTNYTMEEVIDKNDRTFPLYVWNYLQASNNYTNEIVIIGFNSPFNEFYSEDDIIFCPDKCQEIPWLQEAGYTFRYGVMGIVFCCNVEDVKSSKHLFGFPIGDLKPKPIETVKSSNNLNTTVEHDFKSNPVEPENKLSNSVEEENIE